MQTSALPSELERVKGAAGLASDRSPVFSINSVVAGRFQIRRFLGQGGLGQVFAAEDLLLGQSVALKTLHPALARNPDALEVLIQEVNLARKVTHPHVCRIYDLFEHSLADEGADPARVLVLTMELIEGRSLQDHLERHSLPPALALELARQIASGLDAVHDAGVVHGDLAATNVLLDTRRGETRALLADFGLASLAMSPKVAAGGTRAYMAPERRQGKVITAAADIYAFGVLLQEMLGPGKTPKQVLSCLAEAPEDRPRRASTVVEGLRPSLGGSKRRGEPAVRLLLLAILALGLVSLDGGDPQPRSADLPSSPKALREGTRPSVLVPDFHDLSKDEGSEWLAAALPELLTGHLAVGESIVIYPRRYLGQESPDTGAEWRIDGTYLVEGARVHVHVELVERADGKARVEIAESGSVDALFELMERINLRLRAALGAALPAPGERATLQRSLPHSAAAFKAYSSGLDLLRKSEYSSARALLIEALEQEPDFALTQAALAEALDGLGYGREARAHAAKAVTLSAGLTREERLRIEGLHARLSKSWARAEEVARALWVVFPEQLEYGLELARIQNQGEGHRRALETLEALTHAPGWQSLEPRWSLEAARAHFALAEYPEALSRARSAESSAQAAQRRQWIASAQILQADIQLLIGDLEAAEESIRRATFSVNELSNPHTRAELWLLVGDTFHNVGDLDEAAKMFQQAIDFFRIKENRRLLAVSLSRLANVTSAQGRPEVAIRLLEESLTLLRELGDLENVSGALGMLATQALGLCELERAHGLYSEALQIARQLDSPRRLAETLNNVAELDIALGKHSLAASHVSEAHKLAVTMGNPMGEAITLLNLAKLDLDDLDLDQAQARLGRAAVIARELDASFLEAHTRLLEGEMARIRGQTDTSERLLTEAISRFDEIGDRSSSALSRIALARAQLETGQLESAERHAGAALQILRDLDWRAQALVAAGTAAAVAVSQGRLARAKSVLEEAGEGQTKCLDREAELSLLQAEARLLAARGDPASAVGKLDTWLQDPTSNPLPIRVRLELRLLRESFGPPDSERLVRLAKEAREASHLAVARKAAEPSRR